MTVGCETSIRRFRAAFSITLLVRLRLSRTLKRSGPTERLLRVDTLLVNVRD